MPQQLTEDAFESICRDAKSGPISCCDILGLSECGVDEDYLYTVWLRTSEYLDHDLPMLKERPAMQSVANWLRANVYDIVGSRQAGFFHVARSLNEHLPSTEAKDIGDTN